jgi:acetyl esterase/lipase
MTNGTNGAGQVRIEKDVAFGRGGDVELRLDIYYPPDGHSKRTAVVQYHGGGFSRGAKENLAANCRAFAERGYTAISSQYRLSGEAKWPAQLHDAKAAVRWARANAGRLGVDHVCVAGYSAGATLSVIVAGSGDDPSLEGDSGSPGVSSAVDACIAFYPPATRERPANDDGSGLIEASASDEIYRNASPITFAKAGAPPTILMHATGDTTIPFEASQKLFEAYRAAGVAVEMHLFDGLSHVFDRHPEFAAPSIEICDLFLDRHVVEPRVYPPFAPGVARPG